MRFQTWHLRNVLCHTASFVTFCELLHKCGARLLQFLPSLCISAVFQRNQACSAHDWLLALNMIYTSCGALPWQWKLADVHSGPKIDICHMQAPESIHNDAQIETRIILSVVSDRERKTWSGFVSKCTRRACGASSQNKYVLLSRPESAGSS